MVERGKPIRPAATLVLARPAADAFEVLLLKRSARSSFMANVYVYPGGAVDDADTALAESGLIRASRASWGDIENRVHAVAAVRECFEEAGVLLARRREDGALACPTLEETEELRRALNAGTLSFAEVLRRLEYELDLDDLRYFDRWVTPDFESRRFDARFFFSVVPEGQRAECDRMETVDGRWLRPAQALERYDRSEIILAPPTWATLRDLSRYREADEAMSWADAQRPLPLLPHFAEIDGEPTILLPGDPLYPEKFERSGRTRIAIRDGRWCELSSS